MFVFGVPKRVKNFNTIQDGIVLKISLYHRFIGNICDYCSGVYLNKDQ